MKIKDEEGNLLALFVFDKDVTEGKNFYTNNQSEFQVASFLLPEGDEILRHYHPDQAREVQSTSEVLVLLNGEIEVEIYDNNNKHVHSQVIKSGDTVSLFKGGHSLKIIKKSKFIEVKQGPYDEETDKVRFWIWLEYLNQN